MRNFEDGREILLIFGQNIKKVRERKNINMSELACQSKYDRVCLSKLEYGEQNISYKTAVKLAKNLNVSFADLFSRNFSNSEENEFCEDNFLMIFCENIKRELKLKGMMQARIYMECGIQEATISRILSGKSKNPTLVTLYKISVAITDGDMANLFSRDIRK